LLSVAFERISNKFGFIWFEKGEIFGSNLNNALATSKDLNNSAIKATMSEGLVKVSSSS